MTLPLRARLADALGKHWIRAAPELACCCGSTEAYSYHLADVLLSLDGIAVVELPKRSGINGDDNAVWRFGSSYVEQEFNGDVLVNDQLSICADELGDFAAVLLAAANTAERHDD